MYSVETINLTKKFKNKVAVNNVNLKIKLVDNRNGVC